MYRTKKGIELKKIYRTLKRYIRFNKIFISIKIYVGIRKKVELIVY